MGRKLNLDALDDLFEQGKDFKLSDKEYAKRVGYPLPQRKDYIKNRSPFAIRAKEKGFIIADIEEQPVIERTVVLKKKNCEKK